MSALRRNLARLFTSLRRPFPTATPASVQAVVCRPSFQPALPPDRTEMPVRGDRRLAERIRGLCPNRISLDEKRVSLEEIRKVVWASQVAAARERLGATGESSVAYREFVRICCEASSREQGLEVARSLDESGVVIVIGNIVFLRPEETKNITYRIIAYPFISVDGHCPLLKKLALQHICFEAHVHLCRCPMTEHNLVRCPVHSHISTKSLKVNMTDHVGTMPLGYNGTD